MTNNNDILNKVKALKGEIEEYVYGKGITVPSSVLESIASDKDIPTLLKNISRTVWASVGLDVHETLSDHFDGGYSIWADRHIWTDESKAKVKKLLFKKIETVKPTVKINQHFFFEDEKPSSEVRANVLELHKTIAACAIDYTFATNDSIKPELQANAFKAVLQLIDVPEALPSSDPVQVRNTISTSRFKDITKRESDPTPSIQALKEVARNWYQESSRENLYHKDGYHHYNYVDYYLYLLTSEQLEQIRAEFLEDVESKYNELKAQQYDVDAISSAKYLLEKVEHILSWKVDE